MSKKKTLSQQKKRLIVIKNLYSKFENVWFFSFGFFLLCQLGKHFWPNFSYIEGVRIDYLSPTIYLTDLLILSYTIIKLLQYLLSKKRHLPRINNNLSFVLIIGVCLLTINFFISPGKKLWLYRFWQYLEIVLTMILFKENETNKRRYFFLGLKLGTIFSLFLSLAQIKLARSLGGGFWFLGERNFNINSINIATTSIVGQRYLRPYATFSHPNSLSGFYLLAAVLFLLQNTWVYFIFASLVVIFSFSKYPLVILVLFYLWSFWQYKKHCLVCNLAKLGLGLWLIVLINRFQGNPLSLSERFVGYQAAINYLFIHPFGAGLGNYISPLISFSVNSIRYQPVHNCFLLLGLEVGLLGLIYLLSIIVYSFKKKPLTTKKLILIMVVLSLSFFDHYLLTLVQNRLFLGVILGLIYSNQSFLDSAKSRN